MAMQSVSQLRLAAAVIFLSMIALPATLNAQDLPLLAASVDLTSNCAAPCVDGDTSLDGNTAVVPEAGSFASDPADPFGAPYFYDIVRVFTKNAADVWSPQTLRDPDAPALPTDDSLPVSYSSGFGERTAVEGKVLLLSAVPHDERGVALRYVVHVFTRAQGVWTHAQTIILPRPATVDSIDITAVALRNGTALVGTTNWSTTAQGTVERGIVYVYRQGPDHQFRLEAAIAPAAGQNAAFGYPLALRGHTALIGASGDNDARGAAYLYQRVGQRWKLQQKLTASNAAAGAAFGSALAMSGRTLAIGAPEAAGYDSTLRGAVYTFNRYANHWRQTQIVVNPPTVFPEGTYIDFPFGRALALEGGRLLIAGDMPYERGYSGIGSYLFERHHGAWSTVGGLQGGPLSSASISQSRALLGIESLRFDAYAVIYDLPALQPLDAGASELDTEQDSNSGD